MYGAYAHPEHEEDSSSGTFSLASLANIKHGKKLGKTKNLVSVKHIYFSLITKGDIIFSNLISLQLFIKFVQHYNIFLQFFLLNN